MVRQHEVAQEHSYAFLSNPAEVKAAVAKGELVPLTGNADYEVAKAVSFPYARPETRTFVEWLGAEHRKACGRPLVVTSLTRPESRQPQNAHALSVHPTGMAVDFRVNRDAKCRQWLETRLLELEAQNLVDVTREHTPAHVHVAVFPEAARSVAPPAPPRTQTAAAPPAAQAPRAARTAGAPVSRRPSAWVLVLGLVAAGAAAVLYRRARQRPGGHEPHEPGGSGQGGEGRDSAAPEIHVTSGRGTGGSRAA
jgi:hypothetical protein